MLLDSVYCLFGVCYILSLLIAISVVACCFMFSIALVTTLICWFIQPSPNFSLLCLINYGARLVLINEYHMYSCLLSMNFVILCVTVYFTMFCEI